MQVDRASQYRYLIDRIYVPVNTVEAHAIGFDLDGDEHGRVDNNLGQILPWVFRHIDADLNDEIQARIDDGEILQLLDLQSKALDNATNAGLTVSIGADRDSDPSDNFTGEETFAVERRGDVMGGEIVDGVLDTKLGNVPIQLTFPGLEETFVLDLVAARVRATIDEHQAGGMIGGALTEDDVDRVLVPGLRLAAQRIIDGDCTAEGCVTGSDGGYLLDWLDENNDGVVSLDEMRNSDFVSSLLAPDVDLFDQYGNPVPRCDWIKDSMSVGIAFTAVRTRLAEPPP